MVTLDIIHPKLFLIEPQNDDLYRITKGNSCQTGSRMFKTLQNIVRIQMQSSTRQFLPDK